METPAAEILEKAKHSVLMLDPSRNGPPLLSMMVPVIESSPPVYVCSGCSIVLYSCCPLLVARNVPLSWATTVWEATRMIASMVVSLIIAPSFATVLLSRNLRWAGRFVNLRHPQ